VEAFFDMQIAKQLKGQLCYKVVSIFETHCIWYTLVVGARESAVSHPWAAEQDDINAP
jgi:hypothetical protein